MQRLIKLHVAIDLVAAEFLSDWYSKHPGSKDSKHLSNTMVMELAHWNAERIRAIDPNWPFHREGI